MKKFILILTILCLCVFSFGQRHMDHRSNKTTFSHSQWQRRNDKTWERFRIEDVRNARHWHVTPGVIFFGRKQFNCNEFIIGNVAMVPLGVGVNFGVTFVVDPIDPYTYTYVSSDGTVYEIQTWQNICYVNGVAVRIEECPHVYMGQIWVPRSFFTVIK